MLVEFHLHCARREWGNRETVVDILRSKDIDYLTAEVIVANSANGTTIEAKL